MRASSQIEVSKKIARLQSAIEAKKEKILSLRREAERLDSLIERISRIENKINPGVREILKFPGVMGVLLDLIVIPKEYRISVEVAAGGHLSDVVVDRMETAVRCVNHLKAKRLGRGRFLPLNKMLPVRKGPLPPACIGWLSDLIHYDKKYSPVMEYVFGRTACVKGIETARKIMQRQRVRMVTLDGDLVEVSGAVTGGYYRKRGSANVKAYLKEKDSLLKEIESLEEETAALGRELSSLAEKERKTRVVDIEKERQGLDRRLEKIREEKKEAYEKSISLQQELGRLNIQKAKIEARFDSLRLQVPKKKVPPYDMGIGSLREKEKEVMERLQELGPVNLKAIEEFDSIVGEFEEFKEKVDKIAEEKEAIQETISRIEEKRMETFMATLNSIARNFKDVYRGLTGGEAELVLEDPKNLDTGLMIKATPPGKKLLHIDSMSGGEKTLTAFAFLFALQKHKPAPFYILDEADATLDKVNTSRIVSLIKKQSKDAQFIIISHNDELVRQADQIYGVTMDGGESKVMGIELPE
jgi:chromosome segregation ATPase